MHATLIDVSFKKTARSSNTHISRRYFSDLFQTETLILFCILYFILFIMINGIQIPTGIFIPALVVGATWGRIFGVILLKIFPHMVWTLQFRVLLP